MEELRLIEIWIDGACSPKNPGGHMGWGFLAEVDGRVIEKQSGYMSANHKNTNNVAEYRALLDALIWLYKSGGNNDRVHVRGDSMLVINQMNGAWRIKDGNYREFALRCKKALEFFPKISFEWIPREDNEEADELSKQQLLKKGVEVVEFKKFKNQ